MKSVIVFAVAFAGIANAVSIPGWERPIMSASLNHTDGPSFPRAMNLTLNQRNGAKQPTTFTLVEDTGIRCVMAPCPSQKKTQFRITNISHSFHSSDVIRYEAIEVLKNIPINARIAARRLRVTESSMERVAPGGQGFEHVTVWSVEVDTFPGKMQSYYGNPEYLATIMSDLN